MKCPKCNAIAQMQSGSQHVKQYKRNYICNRCSTKFVTTEQLDHIVKKPKVTINKPKPRKIAVTSRTLKDDWDDYVDQPSQISLRDLGL